MIRSVTSPTSPAELVLSVDFGPGSDSALVRALALLHRRRCRVLEASYCSAVGAERLIVRVHAPSRHAHCVETWLSALVDVRAVRACTDDACVDDRPQ